MVCDAIGLLSSAYGTCTARAVSTNSVSFLTNKRYLVMLAKQQRCEAGAVDEQVTVNIAVFFTAYGCDITVRIGIHCGNVIEDMLDAEHLRAVLLQQCRELARIEVIAIIRDGSILGRRGLLGCQTPCAQMTLSADSIGKWNTVAQRQPARSQVCLLVAVRQRKRMVVNVTFTRPYANHRTAFPA